MEIEKQLEYDIRTYIGDLNKSKISEKIKFLLYDKFKNFKVYELIYYSLISIKNGFKK